LFARQDLIQVEESGKLPNSNVDDRFRGGVKYAQVGKEAGVSLLKAITDTHFSIQQITGNNFEFDCGPKLMFQ